MFNPRVMQTRNPPAGSQSQMKQYITAGQVKAAQDGTAFSSS